MADQKKRDSLICAFILDGQGGGRDGWWSQIDEWKPEAGVLWVHLDYRASESQMWLRKSSGLEPVVIEALPEGTLQVGEAHARARPA
jgi:zinc transporter